MSTNTFKVKIFTLLQRFPCGPRSTCCGPIGQSKEEIENLKNTIEKELGYETVVVNLEDESVDRYPDIQRLLGSFGPMALPILTVNDEVVAMGNAAPDEAAVAIKEKLAQIDQGGG